MKKNKAISFSDLKLENIDPRPVDVGAVPIELKSSPDLKLAKKVFTPNKKEFIPEIFVILYTLEGHTTWRVFTGFRHAWQHQLRNMQGTKVTAQRIFKLTRLTGEFNETSS